MSDFSNVGSVPSLPSIFTTNTDSADGAQGAQAAPPPLYKNVFISEASALALGLSQPRNLGDLEAIFAEISAKLSELKDTAGSYSFLAEFLKKSGVLGFIQAAFAGIVQSLTSIDTEGIKAKGYEAEISAKETLKTAEENIKQGLENTKAAAEKTKGELEASLSSAKTNLANAGTELAGVVGEIGKIIGKSGELALAETALVAAKAARAAACAVDIGCDAAKNTQQNAQDKVDRIKGELSDLTGRESALNARISGLESSITALGNDIAAAATSIANLAAQIVSSEGIIGALVNEIGNLTTLLTDALAIIAAGFASILDVITSVLPSLVNSLNNAIDDYGSKKYNTEEQQQIEDLEALLEQLMAEDAERSEMLAAISEELELVGSNIQSIEGLTPGVPNPTRARTTPDGTDAAGGASGSNLQNEETRGAGAIQTGGNIRPFIEADLFISQPFGLPKDAADQLKSTVSGISQNPGSIVDTAVDIANAIALVFGSMEQVDKTPPPQTPQEITPSGRMNLAL